MSEQIAVRIPEDELTRLDEVVAAGVFDSRAAAVREGLRRVLTEQREREVRRVYEAAYAQAADDAAVGEAGAALAAEILDEREPT